MTISGEDQILAVDEKTRAFVDGFWDREKLYDRGGADDGYAVRMSFCTGCAKKLTGCVAHILWKHLEHSGA